MSPIRTVAHAGAAGNLGAAVLKELVDAGFEVTILTRRAGQTPLADSGRVKEQTVNFDDPASLQEALVGIDAVVSTLGSLAVGEPQRALVDAAIAAGVRRFIPSNYGCDQQNKLARQLPVFAEKVKTEDYLVEKAQTTALSYSFIYNNLFLDWGLSNGSLVDLKKRVILLHNGGDVRFSVTRLSTVGKGIVGVLRNLDATENRSIRIEDGKLSFKDLAKILQDTIPCPWTVRDTDTNVLKAESDEALKRGIVDSWVWMNYIIQGGTNPSYGASFGELDNEILGLPELSARELEDLIRDILRTSDVQELL